MANIVRLSYAFRTGALTGAAAERRVHLLAHSSPDHVAAWEKQQELRAGQWNPYDHTFIPPGGRGALGRVLRLSKATGSASVSRSFTGACHAAGLERALFVDDGAGGCFIHDWPPCLCARCIVVPHGLGDVVSAVDGDATLTIVA